MTLAELPVKSEYRSDTDDFVTDFYVPCLSRSNDYWRAVGYFTSRGLAVAAQGLTALIKNDGHMSLVASPVLSREDQEAIKQGYAARDGIIEKSLLRQFEIVESMEDEDRLGYLAWMIAERRLEVRIALAVTSDNSIKDGIYHEKLGIFFDDSSNSIAFTGSPNETSGGLVQNFEAIDVFCSWEDPQNRVARKRQHFENLWSNQTIGLQVISFPEAAKLALLKFRPPNEPEGETASKGKRRVAFPQPLDRWRHQAEALEVYLRNERGVLNMATGTGKTRTALKILVELFERDEIDTAIICTDGNDLLDQWFIELLAVRKRINRVIRVYRNYSSYKELLDFLLEPKNAIFLVSREPVASALRQVGQQIGTRTLLVHDEVHGLGSPGNRARLAGLSDPIRFRLGLSATPDREYDQDGNAFIEAHIGPVLMTFGLKEAIERGILAPFNYFPLPFDLTDKDRERITAIYKKVKAREAAGEPMSQKDVWIEISRVYKTSEAKLPVFVDFIPTHQELLQRCIIFVETMEYGKEVLNIVHQYRPDFHTYFTGDDTETLKRFARGDLECLITCHRLSEGIDIRSLSTVILFSSERAQLETIQRIGRCLRSDPDNPRKFANIVDFIRQGEEEKEPNADELRRNRLNELSQVRPRTTP